MTGKAQALHQCFSTSVLLTFWARSFCAERGCPVRSKMFSSIPDFYPPDANSTSPVVTTQYVSRHCQMSSGGQKSLQVESHCPTRWETPPTTHVSVPPTVHLPCAGSACLRAILLLLGMVSSQIFSGLHFSSRSQLN